MTDVVVSNLGGFMLAVKELRAENFYAPGLIPDPGFVTGTTNQLDFTRAREDWLRENCSKKEVVLSEGYKLVKEYTSSYYRCRGCACSALMEVAPLWEEENFRFNCGWMPCQEPQNGSKFSYFKLVNVVKPKGYTQDQFDFSDWDAIKRATGF